MIYISKKVATAVISILLVIILGLVGFIVYDKVLSGKEAEKEYITVINDVSIDINKLYKVGEILDKLDKAFAKNDSTYQGYIYNNKILEARDFDKNAAIFASMYSDIIRSNTDQTISSERVKYRYKKIFGRELDYKPASLELGDNITVTYDSTNKIYKYKATIVTNDHSGEYLTRNIKTKVEDDKVVVTRRVFYVEYSNNNIATIYTDSSKSSKLGIVKLQDGEVSPKEVIGKFGSKLKTFDYTFKLGSEDEYNLYKIERTK